MIIIRILFLSALFVCASAASRAQSVWLVSESACKTFSYMEELAKELQDTKYGDKLRYAGSVAEIKDAKEGDVVLVFTCAFDTASSNGGILSVGRSFSVIAQTKQGVFVLNLLQSGITSFSKPRFYETLRRNRRDILAMLKQYLK